MHEIRPELIRQLLFHQKSLLKEKAFKDRTLQLLPSSTPFTDICRLKAIYAYFKNTRNICTQRKSASKIAKKTCLKKAMAEAKHSYTAMREIQHQINHAYRDLMVKAPCSKSKAHGVNDFISP